MKITKKMCESVGIINSYDYSLGRLYICYMPGESGRMSRSPRWSVSKKGHDFGGHWMDYGSKVFDVWSREQKKKRLDEAISFSRDFLSMPDAEFVKTPFGSYMLKDFVKSRNKQILKTIKDKK